MVDDVTVIGLNLRRNHHLRIGLLVVLLQLRLIEINNLGVIAAPEPLDHGKVEIEVLSNRLRGINVNHRTNASQEGIYGLSIYGMVLTTIIFPYELIKIEPGKFNTIYIPELFEDIVRILIIFTIISPEGALIEVQDHFYMIVFYNTNGF